METEKWRPLTREQALAARVFSRAGVTFIDYMEKMEIRMTSDVVEFIFGPSKRIMFGDEGQPGLEVGRDSRSKKIVAYMSLDFHVVYPRILKGLKTKPIPGRFSVESADEGDKITPICDPRVKNAAFAEIVQWVWEKYYAHLEEAMPVGINKQEKINQLA